MKSFDISKNFKTDYSGETVLIIKVEHRLNKDRWKDRFLLFHKETATYKKHSN